MPTTRGWALRGNVVNAINYILDIQNGQQKTEEGVLTDWSGTHTFSPYSAGYSWNTLKAMSGQAAKSDIVGYHFQQSFAEGSVTPEEALEISKEWIEKITKGKCEYVMAVHTNTKNIHTHIIVNPIKEDGTMWDIYWKRDKKIFREISDEISKEHGLEILENKDLKSRNYYEWCSDKADDEPQAIKKVLNYLIPRVDSYEQLKEVLDKLGFSAKDGNSSFGKDEENNPHLFCFTCNEVLMDEDLINDPDHLPNQIRLRVPYHKDWFIYVPKECFSWIQPGINARIVLPDSLSVPTDFSGMSGHSDIYELQEHYRTAEKDRSGLRIRVPGGRRYLKTKYFKDQDLSIETIKQRIRNEGKKDMLVDSFLKSKRFKDVQNLRRSVLEGAGVKLNYQSCSSYVSARQEAYYKGLARKCEIRRNDLAYHKLLMDDRKHLPTLMNRKAELLKEIDEINTAIKECEETVSELENDILSETGSISNEQIDDYIKSNILPLKEQREKCRDLISMYTSSIHRVQEADRKQEQKRSSRTG